MKYFFYSLLIFAPTVCSAQPPFERYYNFGFSESGFAVEQTFDGGYIVTGKRGISIGVSDLLLMKTDSLGNVEWTKFIGTGANENEGYDIKQTPDSGYIITGTTTLMVNGHDVYLVKTDKNGDTLWTKRYGGIDYDQAWCVQPTFDGGYVIAAQSGSLPLVLKTNSSGDTLWTKSYLPIGAIGGNARWIEQTPDSGFVICGSCQFTSSSVSTFLVKTNQIGDTVWIKNYNVNTHDFGYSFTGTSDGGFLISGTSGDGSNPYQGYFIKCDSNGDTLWTKLFYNSDGCIRVFQTSDSGFISLSPTHNIGAGLTDFYLIKTDSVGDTLWTKTFGRSDTDSPYDMKITADGGYILVGTTVSFGPLASIYLIKTDSSGFSPVGFEELEGKKKNFDVYPNPNNGKFTIHYSQTKIKDLEIYDMQGKQVFTERNSGHFLEVDISDNPSGIYLLVLRTENGIISNKIIINH